MEILMIVLAIVGILVLVMLFVLLYNLAKTIQGVREVIKDNKRSIDIAILETSRNLEETSKLLKTINMKERELRETMDNIETITSDVAKVTTTVSSTLEKSEEILSAATEAMQGFNKISNAFNHDKSKYDKSNFDKGDKDGKTD